MMCVSDMALLYCMILLQLQTKALIASQKKDVSLVCAMSDQYKNDMKMSSKADYSKKCFIYRKSLINNHGNNYYYSQQQYNFTSKAAFLTPTLSSHVLCLMMALMPFDSFC